MFATHRKIVLKHSLCSLFVFLFHTNMQTHTHTHTQQEPADRLDEVEALSTTGGAFSAPL